MKAFPRFTRRENKRCKLTEEDIQQVKEMRDSGVTYKSIATVFSVSEQTIYYWCKTEKERAKANKKTYKSRVVRGIDTNKNRREGYLKEYRKRKKQTHGKELKEYENQFTTEIRKKRPNYKASQKKADKKYRESLPKGERHRRVIKKHGKDVWNRYHYLRRRGVYKSFNEIADEIKGYIGTIEKEYGVDFGMHPNMKLQAFLKEKGYPSLSKAIESIDKKSN